MLAHSVGKSYQRRAARWERVLMGNAAGIAEASDAADRTAYADFDRTDEIDESGLAATIRMLSAQPTVSVHEARRVLGWGVRVARAAVKSGAMPTIGGPPRPRVPSAWLLRQLRADLLPKD
jgi:hypothetical protein